MNWPARIALAGVCLAATLPLKWTTGRALGESEAVGLNQAKRLKSFLDRQGIADLAPVQLNPFVANWTGWRFTVAGCRAVALPDLEGAEAEPLLSRITDRTTRLLYVYKGRLSARYVGARRLPDRAVERLTAPWRPRDSVMVIVLVLSGDCDPVLRWDWKRA